MKICVDSLDLTREKKKQEKITKQKGNREKHRELEKIHKAKE
jgi:hypothetical protein